MLVFVQATAKKDPILGLAKPSYIAHLWIYYSLNIRISPPPPATTM